GGWSEGQPITLEQIQATGVVTTSSTDRIVTTTWDTRGNKLKVTQAGITYLTAAGTLETGAPTKTFEYDGFGQLVKESVLLDASTSTWADTLHFHDAMGREIRTIDAEGFVTDYSYDARGQLTGTTEWANRIAPDAEDLATAVVSTGTSARGYDRTVVYTYDAL